MSAESIVSRLDGVRESGPGKWMARCPAHADKTPSLSIRELPDETVLLHCFAGCPSIDIVVAIGLEFRDLFPDKHIRRIEPGERPRLNARDALVALDHEILSAWIVASDVLDRREIDVEDWQRLTTAAARIGAARAMCCPAERRR